MYKFVAFTNKAVGIGCVVCPLLTRTKSKPNSSLKKSQCQVKYETYYVNVGMVLCLLQQCWIFYFLDQAWSDRKMILFYFSPYASYIKVLNSETRKAKVSLFYHQTTVDPCDKNSHKRCLCDKMGNIWSWSIVCFCLGIPIQLATRHYERKSLVLEITYLPKCWKNYRHWTSSSIKVLQNIITNQKKYAMTLHSIRFLKLDIPKL